jgi:hypothetical protein
MKPLRMTSLNTAIVIAMTSLAANAQQSPDQPSSTPMGLYVTVSQSEIYIIQDDKQLDVKVGEAAFAGEGTLQQLDAVPSFLNWPCGGSGGEDSGLVPTYLLDSLPTENLIEEVVRRFFEGPEIPASAPAWLNGEFHGSFSAEEINRFTSSAYWYKSGKTTAKMEALRPRVLLISLYPATQQVIVDQNHFQELLDLHGSENIPVTFVFNEENVVPVSALGKNTTMQEIANLFFEKGITIADVPMWYAGDRQFAVSPGDFDQVFEIPAIEDIKPDRLAALTADLQTNGFAKKPVNVALMSQNNSMVVDEAEKVRAAQSIGLDSIPIVFFNYSENSHKKHCGLAMPQVAAGGGIGEGGVASAVAAAGAGVTPAESLLAEEKHASDN